MVYTTYISSFSSIFDYVSHVYNRWRKKTRPFFFVFHFISIIGFKVFIFVWNSVFFIIQTTKGSYYGNSFRFKEKSSKVRETIHRVKDCIVCIQDKVNGLEQIFRFDFEIIFVLRNEKINLSPPPAPLFLAFLIFLPLLLLFKSIGLFISSIRKARLWILLLFTLHTELGLFRVIWWMRWRERSTWHAGRFSSVKL